MGNWDSILLKAFWETLSNPPQNCPTRVDAWGIFLVTRISHGATISPRVIKSPISPEQVSLVLEKALNKNSGKSRFTTVCVHRYCPASCCWNQTGAEGILGQVPKVSATADGCLVSYLNDCLKESFPQKPEGILTWMVNSAFQRFCFLMRMGASSCFHIRKHVHPGESFLYGICGLLAFSFGLVLQDMRVIYPY